MIINTNLIDVKSDSIQQPKHHAPLQIFKKPIESISMMTKSEMEIIHMLTKSLSSQYESFDAKYTAFKQVLKVVKTQTERQNIDLLQRLGTNTKEVNEKKAKTDLVNQPISEKNETSSHEDSSKEPLKKMKGQTIQKSAKSRNPFAHENSIKPKPQPTRRNYSQSQTQSDSEEQPQQKTSDKNNKFEFLRKSHFSLMDMKGPNRYINFKKELQSVMEKQGRIFRMKEKVCHILLQPYSNVKKLLDYNESEEYPKDAVSRGR